MTKAHGQRQVPGILPAALNPENATIWIVKAPRICTVQKYSLFGQKKAGFGIKNGL